MTARLDAQMAFLNEACRDPCNAALRWVAA